MSDSTISSKKTIKVIDSSDYSESFGDKDQFALDILVGLSETRKRISSKYMYDNRGSDLFKQITDLPEYYPTEAERVTIEKNKATIGAYLKDITFNLIELGSGDGRKTKILLDYLSENNFDFRYVPIDISKGATEELLSSLENEYPELEVFGLISDYLSGLKWLNSKTRQRNVVLFLGSNIGNFNHAQARTFLRNLWSSLNNNDIVIIGFDLKKDIEMLLTAYNDPKGVTAEFNLNVLKRINSELGGRFKIENFRHFGTYDVFSGAMESYLVSLVNQEVFIESIGRSFKFREWEPIHMEYSYKYLLSDIEAIACETGFKVVEHLKHPENFFIDSIWEVNKSNSK